MNFLKNQEPNPFNFKLSRNAVRISLGYYFPNHWDLNVQTHSAYNHHVSLHDEGALSAGLSEPSVREIEHTIRSNHAELRQQIWWMNFISMALVGICALVGSPPALIWWFIGAQAALSPIAFYFVDQRAVAAETNSDKEPVSAILFVTMLVEGSLWGLMMLPFTPTLGSDVASTFVCTILIATICIACTLNAVRPKRVTAYFAGFFIALLPQCIIYFDTVGPLPLIATIGLIPAVVSLVRCVKQQAIASITTQLQNKKLSEKLAESLKLASYLANRDALTGLLNRRAFEDAAKSFALNARTESSLAIVLVDLDYFKSINDTFGHGTGDEVLKNIADCLIAEIGVQGLVGRSDAAIARWGGEEFIILLKVEDLLMAAEISERLRIAVVETRSPDWSNELLVTGSFGTAIWERDEGLHDAIHKADQAMYKAKAAGRNRTRAFHDAGCLPIEMLQGAQRAEAAR